VRGFDDQFGTYFRAAVLPVLPLLLLFFDASAVGGATLIGFLSDCLELGPSLVLVGSGQESGGMKTIGNLSRERPEFFPVTFPRIGFLDEVAKANNQIIQFLVIHTKRVRLGPA
jgi:hypothetical protein